VDVCDTAAVLAAAADADLVWLESPTNPCLDVADLVAICGSCSCPVVVDNTLATPLLQRPLALGADIVVHSVTKWLAGHSDVVMGAAVVSSDPLLESLRTRRSLGGAVPGPTEAWLALRGVRTLPARLARAEATAGELAVRLSDHPAVSRVRYPGLPSDPGYALASKQMDGPGAMVSFEMRGGAAAADAVCVGVRLLVPATSLGGVETLIERRGKYANEEATPPALLRMSVGQEDVEDLWEDLSQALG
jgi:cystathionine gamma-synthase